jgi:biopolymer transport protein ExbD
MERWKPLRPLSGWSTLPLIALCVILLVTALTITPMGMVIHGPRLARAATAERLDPRALTVVVDKLGRVWVGNGRGVEPIERTIGDSLAARAAGERRVHLLIDQDVRYELAQTAIAALSRAGLHEIDLLVDCPRGRDGYGRFCATEPAVGTHRGGELSRAPRVDFIGEKRKW